MTEVESIEELQKELERLKAENLKREIAKEKAKIEEEEALKKKEAEEKIREEIRAEEHSKIMEELATKEETVNEKPETLEAKTKAERLKANMMKKYGYTGKTYEERIRDLVDKGYKW
jgi:hypothetical protein